MQYEFGRIVHTNQPHMVILTGPYGPNVGLVDSRITQDARFSRVHQLVAQKMDGDLRFLSRVQEVLFGKRNHPVRLVLAVGCSFVPTSPET